MSENTSTKRSGRKLNLFVFLPGIAFFALAIMFGVMLFQPGRDTSVVPSALIGKAAPNTPLPAIPGLTTDDGQPLPGFDPEAFDGPVVVNVWASWCGPCREEHPILMALSEQEGVTLAGLNYKDKTDAAVKFLGNLGNPYDMAGADSNGRAGIEWGVYGVPETFVVSADGEIIYKHVGPLTPEVAADEIIPRLRKDTPSG